MILADDNFATIINAVREGRVVWDNLRKVLLVNTPINNAQGFTVLFSLALGFPGDCTTPTGDPLNRNVPPGEKPECTGGSVLMPVQVLYCNLICACTLGFVTAVEPAEEGIMDIPPRRVGKRLIGRFLFMRIALGTILLTVTTVASAFWNLDLYRRDIRTYNSAMIRSQALNALSFGAVAVTISARFSRKSAFHIRSFMGNKLAYWSYAIMTLLQVAITYIPGLNVVVFWQNGMDWIQWMIVILMMVIVLIGMEMEKCLRNYLSALKYDVDDREDDAVFDDHPAPDTTPLPDDVKRFGTNELAR